MTATVAPQRAAEQPDQPKPPLSLKQKLTRGGLLLTILLIVAMWVYAFGFASKKAAAQLDDSAWSKRAEEICDRRNDRLADNARTVFEGDDHSPQALGQGFGAGTDLIEAALDDVVAVQPASQSDIAKVAEFERLYRMYIADRRQVEAKLASGEMTELNETTLNGSPISETITDFTNPNRMPSCAPPPAY